MLARTERDAEAFAAFYAAYALACIGAGIKPLTIDALRELVAAMADANEQ